MTGLVGALIEAWQELRIHRLRVLLSLVGVAVAVAAMTGIAALITVSDQAQREMLESENGREGSVIVWLTNQDGTEPMEWMRTANEEFATFVDRHEIRYASRNMWTSASFTAGGLPAAADLMVVDHAYGLMHRISPIRGTWFDGGSDDRFAPPVVVNEAFLNSLRLADRVLPLTVEMNLGDPAAGQVTNTVVVTGVVADKWEYESPRAFILNAAYSGILERHARPGLRIDAGEPELEVWVGPDLVWEAEEAANAALGAMGASVMVQEYGWIEESSRIMKQVGFSITGLVLGLAALNLLTISMVTLRGRIREIGIRRAFGATSRRIFFAVMMESVVATVLAGGVGVAIAAAAFANLPLDEYLIGMPLQDRIAFPAGAAVLGLAVASAVGALAGLIPALVAVRVRPIDAIRF